MNTCFGAHAPYKIFAKQKSWRRPNSLRPSIQIRLGSPRGLTRGEFITCCEEEKLATLKEGKAFHIKNGMLV